MAILFLLSDLGSTGTGEKADFAKYEVGIPNPGGIGETFGYTARRNAVGRLPGSLTIKTVVTWIPYMTGICCIRI